MRSSMKDARYGGLKMGDIVSSITDAVGLTDTEDAGDQARKASRESAAAQEEAREYMIEADRLPRQFREEGLQANSGRVRLRRWQRYKPRPTKAQRATAGRASGSSQRLTAI